MNPGIGILLMVILNSQINAEISGKEYASIPDLFYEDNFDKCMLLGDEALYCYIKYILVPIDEKNPSVTWNYIKNISSIETNYRHDHLRHSICVPKSCPKAPNTNETDTLLKKGIEDCYNDKFRDLELQGTISEIRCQSTEPRYPVDSLDIISGFLFITYLLFVLYATYYEQAVSCKSVKDHEKLTTTPRFQFLTAFSLFKNWNRLMTVISTPMTEKLKGIQGIRFYNSALVVMSHTLMGFLALPIANTRFMETLHTKPATIFFACGHLCMTTFFFISSFLLANDLFEYLKNKKGFSFQMGSWIFAARIFRQLPPLAVTILLHATWFRHMGNGPHWEILVVPEYKACRKNWWTNLLFINNLVDPDHMCLQTSWWLALSTQYIILTLLLIWALKKYENYFSLIIGTIMSFSIVGTFLENYYYDFPSLLIYQTELCYDLPKFLASTQIKYQLRGFIENLAGPVAGVAFAYVFNKRFNDSSKTKIFNTKLRVFCWCLIVLGVGIGCVVVPGVGILFYPNEHDAFWASVYMGLARPLFSIFVGVLIMGFSEEIGWIALRVCKWPPIIILGRLTYSVYLVQMVIVLFRPSISRFPVYISEYIIAVAFFGDIIGIYIAATFLTLFVELPVSALQKLIFFPTKQNNKTEENKTMKKE